MAKKILIVDDDATLCDMYAERLSADGFEIIKAANGDEGVHKAKSEKPDLILMDVMMPKKNGFEALEEIKSDPATKSIPVYMLTALIQEENKEKAKKMGARGYIIKSETMPNEILAEVKKAL